MAGGCVGILLGGSAPTVRSIQMCNQGRVRLSCPRRRGSCRGCRKGYLLYAIGSAFAKYIERAVDCLRDRYTSIRAGCGALFCRTTVLYKSRRCVGLSCPSKRRRGAPHLSRFWAPENQQRRAPSVESEKRRKCGRPWEPYLYIAAPLRSAVMASPSRGVSARGVSAGGALANTEQGAASEQKLRQRGIT